MADKHMQAQGGRKAGPRLPRGGRGGLLQSAAMLIPPPGAVRAEPIPPSDHPRLRGTWPGPARWRHHAADLIAMSIGILLALPILLPEQLPLPGLRGADTEAVLRSWQLTLALRNGHWPPRWMPDALYGLGYPFWNFHGPLPYVGAALASLGQAGIEALRGALPAPLGGGGPEAAAGAVRMVAGTRVALGLWLVLAAIGAARLVRPWRPRAAWAAALLLPVAALLLAALEGPGAAPARLAQAALLPWALGAAIAIARGPGGGEPAAGLRWSVLLALLFSAEPRADRPWLALATLLGGLGWALVLRRRQRSARLPAPSAAEASPAFVGPATGSGASPLPLRTLLSPAGLRLWLARREQARWQQGEGGQGGAASAPVLLAGGGLLGLGLAAWFWLPALGEAGALQALDAAPAPLGGGRQVPANETMDRDALARYESLTGRLATLAAAPLPLALREAPAGGPALVQGAQAAPRPLGGGATLDRVTAGLREPARRDWRLVVAGDRRASLAFPVLWFPGWEAQVNGGRPRPTSAIESTGWLRLDLEAGECTADCSIVLRLGRSPLRAAAELVSLLAALLWLLLWLLDRRRRLLPSLLGLLLAWLLVSVLAWLLPRPNPGQAVLFAWLPGSGAPLPQAFPAGLTWEGARRAYRLVDAVFSLPDQGVPPAGPREARRDPGLVDAGGPLELRLQWRPAVAGLKVRAQWLPAAAPQLAWPGLVTQAEATGHVGQELLLRLEPPPVTADGLYIVRLRVEAEGRPLQVRDGGGADLYLGPLRLHRRPERLPAVSGTLAQLGELTLVKLEADALVEEDPRHRPLDAAEGPGPAFWLPVEATWKTGRTLTLNHRRSLRLLDAEGEVLAGLEGQPFGGILPTSLWQTGEPLVERLWLPLPDLPEAKARLRLEVEVFDGNSGESQGRVDQPTLIVAP